MERRALLVDALRSSHSLQRVGSPMARSLSRLLQAAVADQQGRTEEAATGLEMAARELDEQEMAGHAAAARARLVRLGAGASPALDGQEILGDEGFVRMLAPGFAEP